ncbi:MAG: tRNA (adenosine(37)-N6)-dimethylallyltransferase MiaA [Actinomycetota bacterium]
MLTWEPESETAPTLAIVGATATGKTQVAIHIAAACGLEIICADSQTVYQRMDIGTAKPTREQRERVRHHMLDLIEPDETMTVSMFQEGARAVRQRLDAAGTRPVIVGGSGLYLKTVIDDLRLPPSEAEVRQRLEAMPPGDLVAALRRLDPPAAGFIDPNNTRRVIRALEVIEITGQPFSSFRQDWERRQPAAILGLQLTEESLQQRIRTRTLAMLEAGWEDECRDLEDSGFREAVQAKATLGYAEVYSMLDGLITRDEATDRICAKTRKLARQQMTWFKADPRIHWIEASDPEHTLAQAEAYFTRAMELG